MQPGDLIPWESQASINADVTEKAGQIETLNGDIAEKTGQIDTLNTEVSEKTETIETYLMQSDYLQLVDITKRKY